MSAIPAEVKQYLSTLGHENRSGANICPDDEHALKSLVRRLVARHPDRPLKIVEVGSWLGESALAMEKALGPQGGEIYCVDTWEGSPTDDTGKVCAVWSSVFEDPIYQSFRYVTRDSKAITPVRGKSLSVGFRPERYGLKPPFDLIFLDADHSYEALTSDIAVWMRHLGSNGIIAGHDYGDYFDGVARAVKEMFERFDVESLVWSHDAKLP